MINKGLLKRFNNNNNRTNRVSSWIDFPGVNLISRCGYFEGRALKKIHHSIINNKADATEADNVPGRLTPGWHQPIRRHTKLQSVTSSIENISERIREATDLNSEIYQTK